MIHLSNIEQVLYATCRIEVKNSEETVEGTGFFVGFNHKDRKMAVALVSCRHLLEGAEVIKFWIPEENDEGKPSSNLVNISINVQKGVTLHPDPEIDLACIIIHHIQNHTQRRLFYRAISEKNIPTGKGWGDLRCGEDIYVLGCPLGIVEGHRRSPIIRKGVISSLDNEINIATFLIDVPTLPGSSGSPVIVDSHICFDSKSGSYLHKSRFYLVGIVMAGIEDHSDNHPRDAHLGRVIKADQLDELFKAMLKQYGLVKS